MVEGSRAVIVGAAESPYSRHPPEGVTTEWLLGGEFARVLARIDLRREDVDGLGVASFTLAPDRAIDLAWKIGVRPRWLMGDGNGGPAGIQLLQHAMQAVDAGDAKTIVLLSGDHFGADDFKQLVDNYSRTTVQYLAGIPTGGPNAFFAMLTRQQPGAHVPPGEDGGIPVVGVRS